MVIARPADAVCDAESVTCTVKLEVPADVGVPEIAPVDGASINPAGSEPTVSAHA
jgi:hypothetical protein